MIFKAPGKDEPIDRYTWKQAFTVGVSNYLNLLLRRVTRMLRIPIGELRDIPFFLCPYPFLSPLT